MRTIASALAIVVLALCAIAAQQTSPEDPAVRKAIEDHYFKAISTGNGEPLRGMFVDEGRMMWVQDGRLRVRTSAEFIGGFNGQPPRDEAKRKRRIVMTDVTGDTAIAKVELDHPGVFFTDYFTLHKIGDGWKIVHKSYHRRPQ